MQTLFITRIFLRTAFVATILSAVFASGSRIDAQTPTPKEQTPPAQLKSPGSPTPQAPTPKSPTSTPDAADGCRTPATDAEKAKLKAQLLALQEAAQTIVNEITGLEEEQRSADKQVEHFNQVVKGNEELTPDEVDEKIVPAAGQATAAATSKDLGVAIAQKKVELQKTIDESKPITAKLNDLDKLKPCSDKTGETVVPPPPPPAPPAQPRPANANGCRDAEDEAKLQEYKRIIIFTEKEISETQDAVKRLDIDIDQAGSDDRMDAELRKARVERLKALKGSLGDKINNDKITLEEFKAAVKAILAKVPCPPPAVTTPQPPAVPVPGPQHAEPRDPKHPKKALEHKNTKRSKRSAGPANPENATGDTLRGLSIGIGIGSGLGGRERGRRNEQINDKKLNKPQ